MIGLVHGMFTGKIHPGEIIILATCSNQLQRRVHRTIGFFHNANIGTGYTPGRSVKGCQRSFVTQKLDESKPVGQGDAVCRPVLNAPNHGCDVSISLRVMVPCFPCITRRLLIYQAIIAIV